MKLIVGLGNPGEKYHLSRHNLGFMVVERLREKPAFATASARQAGSWKLEKRFKAEIAEKNFQTIGGGTERVLLVKPQTFMNCSGEAVRLLLDYYKVAPAEWPENLLVIHDDLDFPLGKLKIQRNISSAGHKGVLSIIESLRSQDFIRFRLGVGEADSVLTSFPKEDLKIIEKTVNQTAEAVFYTLENGLAQVMNKYN